MRTPKIRFLLLVGSLALICVAMILSGCARFKGIADFTASPTSGKKPLLVQFTPVAEGSVRRYVWNFGDGQSSTERSPEHTYVDAGVYTVILTVDPRQGEPISVHKKNYITVAAAGFGDSPTKSRMIVRDDAFELPRAGAVYELDVLANDEPADGADGLTIIGVSADSGVYYDAPEVVIRWGTASINSDGTAIEYDPYVPISDTFYYRVTDGQTTSEGRVQISYEPDDTSELRPY